VEHHSEEKEKQDHEGKEEEELEGVPPTVVQELVVKVECASEGEE
jgi:hypothetical protein